MKNHEDSIASSGSDSEAHFIEKEELSNSLESVMSVRKPLTDSSSTLVRDSWMTETRLSRPQLSSEDIKLAEEAKVKADLEAKRKAEVLVKGGILNRSEESGGKKKPYVVGDGGASWRARALLRAKQRATEEGTSVDEILSETHGSVKDLHAKDAAVSQVLKDSRLKADRSL